MKNPTYKEARDGWLPEEANIIYENSGETEGVVVYAWDGHLNVLRLFKYSTGWDVSVDYCEYVDDIRELR
jgi:hypothetical protein